MYDCPNCRNKLQVTSCDNNLAVDHCNNCGGTFFKENEINRLTLVDARRLAFQKTNESISGEEKLCPKDKKPLIQIRQQSLPQYVTLLQCNQCRGVFAYPDDLVEFKKAQKAKINYYKIWQIPLPSLQAVLIYSFVFAAALTVVYAISPLSRQPQKIKATQEICPIEVIQTDSTFLVYCKSPYSFRSTAKLVNSETEEVIYRAVNDQPSTVHLLSIAKSDIPSSGEICVSFVLMSDDSKIETTCAPLLTN